jgi:hypothetical protein
VSEQIFSDKDYLDAQFGALHKRLDKLDSLPGDVEVLKDWRKEHSKSHTRATRLKLTAAGLILSAAGLVAKLTS